MKIYIVAGALSRTQLGGLVSLRTPVFIYFVSTSVDTNKIACEKFICIKFICIKFVCIKFICVKFI